MMSTRGIWTGLIIRQPLLVYAAVLIDRIVGPARPAVTYGLLTRRRNK